MNVSQVVAAFGGTCAMAAAFGVGPSAVSNWKRSGRFPARLHYRIAKIAQSRGIEIPEDFFDQATKGEAE